MNRKSFGNFVACTVAALALTLFATVARAQDDASAAQNYVQTNVQTALGILQDPSLSTPARRDRMHTFLLSLLDTQRIAMFTLGAAQSSVSPDQLAAYTEAFRDFMVANYDSKLGNYTGQTLRVTGAVQRAPGDYVVTTQLVDPTSAKAPQEVDFRVVDNGGKLAIVDASYEGVWLAIAERDDFQSFLGSHNGDVAALTAHLREMTAQLNAAA